mgnify:CR=1 FL=1
MTHSNYPPGVTGNEPQIVGTQHYQGCPLAEDFQFSDTDYKRIDLYELKELVEAAYRPDLYHTNYTDDVMKAAHQFLWMLQCSCPDITDASWEAAQERKLEMKET